jgi:copper chaperone CopZ
MNGTEINLRDVNLRIEGMHCGACIRRVTQTLQSVPGAEVEEVRLGAARVQLPLLASADDLIAKLGKAGFAAQQES